jgi:hypothetical protein
MIREIAERWIRLRQDGLDQNPVERLVLLEGDCVSGVFE